MSEYREYPKEVWGYLNDMLYMPSRLDRNRLYEAGDQKHVQIWDYFFQINPDDVGLPQKREISQIDKRLGEAINLYNNKQKEIKNSIKELQRSIFLMRLKNLLLGFVGLILSVALSNFLAGYLLTLKLIIALLSPFILYSLAMWISVGLVGRKEKNEIRYLTSDLTVWCQR